MQDDRGLTALMKAAIRGKNDCIAALIMAGILLIAADFPDVDFNVLGINIIRYCAENPSVVRDIRGISFFKGRRGTPQTGI